MFRTNKPANTPDRHANPRPSMTRRLFAHAVATALAVAGAWTLGDPDEGRAAAAEPVGEPVAEVLRVRGAVSVERGGTAVAVTAGAKLGAADVVTTGPDGRAQIRLADGSVLTLAPGSGYRLSEFAVDAASGRRAIRITPLAGLIQAAVAKAAPGSKFEVELAFAVASVRGTEFMFELQTTQCVVFVRGGEVSVLHKNPRFQDRNIVMRPGEGTTVRPDAPPTYAAKWSDDLATRWIEKVSFP